MKIKKQILLGSKDIISKGNVDEYLHIQLTRSSKELLTDNIENQFDLTQQYVTERNASLKFCLYGIVESKFANCTNLNITITNDSNNLNMYLPKITTGNIMNSSFTVQSNELSSGSDLSTNMFGYDKASYNFLFEINSNDIQTIITNAQDIITTGGTVPNINLVVSINDTTKNLYDIFNMPFIYFDANGNLIPFGTQDAVIDLSGNTIQINNDFPFFYDRHWIKFNLDVSKNGTVFFPEPQQKQTADEALLGTTFDISLDYPSKFGREQITVDLDTLKPALLNGRIADSFSFAAQTFSWNIGEQTKIVNVTLIDDLTVGNPENVFFTFTNPINCTIKSPNSFELDILDLNTPAQLNFELAKQTITDKQNILPINIVFDKPIELDGQSFDIYFDPTQTTNAVPGIDFGNDVSAQIISIQNDISKTQNSIVNITSEITIITGLGLSSIALNTDLATANALLITQQASLNKVKSDALGIPTVYPKKGDTGATAYVTIIEDTKYNTDKIIVLSMSANTSNIELGTVNPIFIITVTSSFVTLYTDYVFPVNSNLGFGFYEMNAQISHSQSYLWETSTIDAAFSQRNKNFTIEVINDGETVLYNDTLILNGQTLTSFIVPSSGITENLVLTLPSNYNLYVSPLIKEFKSTKYRFVITGIYYDKAFSGQNPPFTYADVIISSVNPATFATSVNAGIFGSIQTYLITDLSNINVAFDNNLKVPVDYVFNHPTNVKINGTAFVAPAVNGFGQNIANPVGVSSYFSYDLVQPITQFISNSDGKSLGPFQVVPGSMLLPFGYTFVDNTNPISLLQEKYINLNFGNIFSQIGSSANLSTASSAILNSKLRTQSKIDTNDPVSLFNWNDTSTPTKSALDIRITNTSFKTLKVSGTTLTFGNSLVIQSPTLDNLVIVLPTNASFNSKTNMYDTALYEISIENIQLYDLSNNYIGTMPDIIVDVNFLPSMNNINATDYFLTTKYSNIGVASTNPGLIAGVGYNFLECIPKNINPIYTIYYPIANVEIYGALLLNSATQFVSAKFVDAAHKVVPACPLGEIIFSVI